MKADGKTMGLLAYKPIPQQPVPPSMGENPLCLNAKVPKSKGSLDSLDFPDQNCHSL